MIVKLMAIPISLMATLFDKIIGWRLTSVCLVALGMAWNFSCLAGNVETHRFLVRADEAFEKGQGAWGVKRTDDGAIALYDRVLVEDDGPGIGTEAWWMKTDRAPVTEIAGDTQIKKVLHIERLSSSEVLNSASKE
jgi:hypothetical protein